MISVEQSTGLMNVAIRAAQDVGEPLVAVFRSVMGYGYKRDVHDIVTEHDLASERRITSIIMAEVPDSTIVGEEGGRRGKGRVVWHVDPIDGTSNFARGIAFWCISIAAAIDDQLVAGVIYDPVAKAMFSADLAGAWRNGSPLSAEAYPDQQRAMLLTSFPNARHLEEFGSAALGAQEELLKAFLAIRNLGSGALQLAHVAAGWADAALGFRANSWDVAAGALILRRAGGRYVGLNTGAPVEPGFLAPDYYAHGRGADYRVLDRVARTISAHPPQRD